MMPWERDIYVGLLLPSTFLEEERRLKEQQRKTLMAETNPAY